MRIDIAWRLLFAGLDREHDGLSRQIGRVLVDAIEAGVLAPDTRLPSSRGLAEELGLSRNTVTAAYRQLIDEGVLVSRDRSGCFVAARTPCDPPAEARSQAVETWSSRFAVHPSRMPFITKPRDWLRHPYPFLYGQFDPSLFPTHAWRESVRAASSVREISGWAGDMIDDDDPELLEQLRLEVLPRRGILAAPGEIIVTIGSQHALSMLVQLLVGRDTPAGHEDPGYPDVRNMLALATPLGRALTGDRWGVVPDEVFASCRVAFVTAGHQCPTTAVMPVARRRELLAAASRHGVVIVEDDYEADLSVEGDADLPSLKSLDEDGRVIYVGSFSKVLAPGLRIGYIVAPRPVIDELRVLRRLMLRHPPTNNQRSLAAFISLGHYRRHLKRTATLLRERAGLVSALLPELMPDCRFRRDLGAKSFWVEGPPSLDGRELVVSAFAHGVLIEAGDIFFADPSVGRRFFRLGFTSIADHRIEPGLRRLAGVVGGAT